MSRPVVKKLINSGFPIKLGMTLLLALMLGGFVVPQKAEAAGWLTGWGFRKKITISKTNVNSTLANFPLLVKFAETGGGASNIGSHSATTGFDVRFTSSDGTTLLAYEKESFAIASNNLTANIWVKIPTVSSTAGTDIYVYYGNVDASTDYTATTGTGDCSAITVAQCTWKEGASQNFKGVYHLNNLNDSTSNGNNLTSSGSPSLTTGKISGGYQFTASNRDALYSTTIPVSAYPVVMSGWFYTADTTEHYLGTVGRSTSPGTNTDMFGLDLYGQHTSAIRYRGTGNELDRVQNSATYTTSSWQYNSCKWVSNTDRKSYLNGSNETSGSGVSITFPTSPSHFTLGNVRYMSAFDNVLGLNGTLDEFRISSIDRSADWVKFEYYNQSSANNELAVASQEQAPFLTGWAYRKKITIPKTNVTSTLTNFPFYARINADSAIGAKALASGYDIRFTSADGTTLLAYERESWTGGVGVGAVTANFWVKVPTISNTANTEIYVYYGKASATDDWTDSTIHTGMSSADQTNCSGIKNSQCTWKEGSSQNFAGVWHFGNASSPATDSVTGGHNASQFGGVTFGATGKIDGATSYAGNNSYLQTDLLSAGTLDGYTSATFQFWIKPTSPTQPNTYGFLLGKVDSTGNTPYYFYYKDSGDMHVWFTTSVGGILNYGTTTHPIIEDSWNSIVYKWDGTSMLCYINGISVPLLNSTASGTMISLSSALRFGLNRIIASEYSYKGATDETRISSTARSADWIKFEYCNMVASDVTTCGGTNNYEQTYGSAEFLSANTAKLTTKITQPVGTTWLTGWSYRKKITVYKKNVGSASLSNFPLYVRVNADSKMAVALANGFDVRFTTSDGTTLLAYERESWTGGGGSSATANFWVKVPTISNTANTEIYIYYGNASANTDWTDSTTHTGMSASDVTNCSGIKNSQCTWKEGATQSYAGVWHLKETGTGAVGDYKDSTANANSSTNTTGQPTVTTSGKISNAESFGGSEQNVSMGTPSSLNITGSAVTMSAWVNPPATQPNTYGIIIQKWNNVGYEIVINGNVFKYAMTTGGVQYGWSGTKTVPYNAWSYLTAVYNGSNTSLYINGVYQEQFNHTGTINDNSAITAYIGKHPLGPYSYSGLIDETRVSSTTRSVDWVKFEYCNMMSSASGTCTGTNETGFGGQEATTANILKVKTGKATIKIK